MPNKPKPTIKVVRDSGTGRFVPPSRAKTQPKNTETEVYRRKK